MRISVLRAGVLSIVILMGLLACSTNKSPQYLKATTIEPIQLPEVQGVEGQVIEEQSKERLGELYPVRQVNQLAEVFKVPLPPVIGVQGDSVNIASLETMGEQSWVVNAKSAATTWSQLMAFLQQRGITVVKRDLATATLETGWFEQAVQPGFVVRYRLRLEHGLQPNTTEVYFVNDKSTANTLATSQTHWDDKPHDSIHANWFANELIKTLNDPRVRFSDSYLATTIKLQEKVTLSELNAEPVLFSNTSDQRLQKALEKTLNENGFAIYDKALDKGVFHFDEYKVKKKKSILFGLVGASGDSAFSGKSRHPLSDILARLPNEPEGNNIFGSDSNDANTEERLAKQRLSGVPGYLLVMQQRQEHTVVWVRDGYGRLLKSSKARDILDTIRLRLI